jgi:hypothetical protein
MNTELRGVTGFREHRTRDDTEILEHSIRGVTGFQEQRNKEYTKLQEHS